MDYYFDQHWIWQKLFKSLQNKEEHTQSIIINLISCISYLDFIPIINE